MKKIFLAIIIIQFLSSCKKQEDKIEIYLTKERIRSIEGMPLLEYAKLKKIPIDESGLNLERTNYDSLKQEIIYGGKFLVKESELKTEPLINDTDILRLNLKKSELILSQAGRDKISTVEPGSQFTICVNKKPILTGYFRYAYSSVIYNWNYISYNKSKNGRTTDSNFVIRRNNGYSKWKPFTVNLSEYSNLIDAFKKSNRLGN